MGKEEESPPNIVWIWLCEKSSKWVSPNYYIRYNSIYNSIPANLKPTPYSVLLKFPDGFDADMAYQLRERDAYTLEKMQLDVVSVEINILAKKTRLRNERRVTIKEENSNSDAKIYSLAKTLERMMDKIDNIEKNTPLG